MFKKNNSTRLESIIGTGSSFRGDVDVKGTLRVDGHIEGNITAGYVIVGEQADIKGNITANGIAVGGKVEGNLNAGEIVEITTKAYVCGDVITGKLSIAEGGTFNGKVLMDKSKTNIFEFQAKEN